MKLLLTAVVSILLMGSSFANGKAKESLFKVDVKASHLKWVGKKVLGQHDGKVMLKEGKIVFENGRLSGGEFVINMDSISVDDIKDAKKNKGLVGHLKSKDFFGLDKEKNKLAFLNIKKVTLGKGGHYNIVADLTIKGMTKPVFFDVVVKEKKGMLMIKTLADKPVKIDRTMFNIRYGSGSFFEDLGNRAIDNIFTIAIDVTAKK